jgi:[ribosomal protein S5]-alanine N-acetyltransferase
MEPVLSTQRLALRHITPEDSAFLVELMNEPGYIENIGDRGIRTIADASKYIEAKFLSSYVQNGFGLFLVEMKEGAMPIGICGLVKRDALDRPDLGFAYLQRFWSRGFATEAARAVLKDAQESLKLSCIYGLVSPANVRSIRLLEHLGFSYLRPLEVKGQKSAGHLYETELRPS